MKPMKDEEIVAFIGEEILKALHDLTGGNVLLALKVATEILDLVREAERTTRSEGVAFQPLSPGYSETLH